MEKFKLLIVEDEEVLKLMLERILKISYPTIDILTASDGLEGLEQFKNNQDINLILTDVNMDRMNGFEMINQLSSKYQKIPNIIVMSAWPENEKQAKINDCIKEYLPKPFNKSVLIPVLNRLEPRLLVLWNEAQSKKNFV